MSPFVDFVMQCAVISAFQEAIAVVYLVFDLQSFHSVEKLESNFHAAMPSCAPDGGDEVRRQGGGGQQAPDWVKYNCLLVWMPRVPRSSIFIQSSALLRCILGNEASQKPSFFQARHSRWSLEFPWSTATASKPHEHCMAALLGVPIHNIPGYRLIA